MRFADEPAERAPSRQVTRGDRSSDMLERGGFDREIERLTDGTSDDDEPDV